jgi:RNA polymerase primary sigma factor
MAQTRRMGQSGGGPTAPQQERDLFARAKAGDVAARDDVVARNMGLVVMMAARYKDRGLDLDDLAQEGAIGLLEAIARFEPERGFAFSTYAIWWIRQAIGRAVQSTGAPIRIPAHLSAAARAIAEAELSGEEGGGWATGEGARHAGIGVTTAEALRAARRRPLSLDRPVRDANGDGTLPLADTIADHGVSPEEVALDRVGDAELATLLAEVLPPHEASVIALRMGVGGTEGATQAEVGKVLGVVRGAVYQREQSALGKLRARRVLARLRGDPTGQTWG